VNISTDNSESDANTDRPVREIVRLNAHTIGIAFGVVGGWGLLLATLWLVLKRGSLVGPHLMLLVNYLPAYRISFLGSVIGFFYGFVSGFIAGFLVASLYNYIVLVKGN